MIMRNIKIIEVGVAAIVLTTAPPILKRASQEHGIYPYNTNAVYFFSEVIQLITAASWCHRFSPNKSHGRKYEGSQPLQACLRIQEFHCFQKAMH